MKMCKKQNVSADTLALVAILYRCQRSRLTDLKTKVLELVRFYHGQKLPLIGRNSIFHETSVLRHDEACRGCPNNGTFRYSGKYWQIIWGMITIWNFFWYSGDLKCRIVWILNGQKELGMQIVRVSNGMWNPEAQPFLIQTNDPHFQKTKTFEIQTITSGFWLVWFSNSWDHS